jgi:ribosome-interacting GTPase 1
MIDKEGVAQVAVIGPPNVGKSSLVSALTNASPEITDFPHTTYTPTPGMAVYENIQFQLVDTPPIAKGYVDSWMVDLIRRADIVLILLDLHTNTLQGYEDTTLALEEMRVFAEGFPIPEDLNKRPFLKKICVVVNKVDAPGDVEDYEVFLELAQVELPGKGISVQTGFNLDELLEMIYELSGIIRVYTKAPGKTPDFKSPFALAKGSTLGDLACRIHGDFLEQLKYARMWGRSVHDGQMVQRDYVLQDGDIAEIHK